MNIGINDFQDEEEQLAGIPCPLCGYPLVFEYGIEVCYRCGWCEDDEEEDDIQQSLS